MKVVLQHYFLLLVILLFNVIIFLFRPETGQEIMSNFTTFSKKMLINLPPIFVLLSLLDVWLPKDLMARYLGGKSGPFGICLTMLLGLTASGPHYGAFPVALSILNKGASFTNAMVFVGSWSILKISMILYEISILGIKFGLTRMLINIPGIIIIAILVDFLVPEEEKKRISNQPLYDIEGPH